MYLGKVCDGAQMSYIPLSLVLLLLSVHIPVVVVSPVPCVIVAVDIAGVVVDADRHPGAVEQELDPVGQQLQRNEVTKPVGQIVSTPHYYGDVGQSWRRSLQGWNEDRLAYLRPEPL